MCTVTVAVTFEVFGSSKMEKQVNKAGEGFSLEPGSKWVSTATVSFKVSAQRRMEMKSRTRGVVIYNDFAAASSQSPRSCSCCCTFQQTLGSCHFVLSLSQSTSLLLLSLCVRLMSNFNLACKGESLGGGVGRGVRVPSQMANNAKPFSPCWLTLSHMCEFTSPV